MPHMLLDEPYARRIGLWIIKIILWDNMGGENGSKWVMRKQIKI